MTAVETIVEKIKTALASITTGGGYNNTIVSTSIYRRVFAVANESSTDFPVIALYTREIKREDPEDKVSMSYVATIIIEAWVALGDDAVPETALNSLQQDITDLVYSDPTWTGSADTTDVGASEYMYGTGNSAVVMELLVKIYDTR